ncbi:hypothetical protein LOTGIDRAFT_174462 [Lottia gigantea]|uniref:Ig-like domain-containing protein n=1 Tax=Lottia gigantea TaxID=225164 RepID=V4AT14_LOTGI|nr:hypothetical protein LOTGIDRAFT_174462 [Lottia gigantea]ESO98025.1 hypothetical protein LOTGIDRAFT_174462 [Lottia gigantea]
MFIITIITVPVSSVENTNKNEDLIKDRTVNLECKTTGGYPLPNITWSIDTRILMTSVNTTTSSLSYQPVVSDQGQRLQCSATNGYGQSQTDSFQLDIKFVALLTRKIIRTTKPKTLEQRSHRFY